MEINQVIVSASPGDAVTNSALALRDLLRRVGPSDIFARYIDERLEGEVFSLQSYESRKHPPGSMMIYHSSIGEPEVVAFLLERRERLVLLYHNITPAEYFAGIDPAFAQLLACGRTELAMLRDRVEVTLAVSEYNARELEAIGYADVRVSPLPIDLTSLHDLPSDPSIARDLSRLKGPLVLFVGQVLPHKRPDLLLQAHHVLSTYLIPEAHLAMLGPVRMERYRRALQIFVADLNFPYVLIPGWLKPEELATFYRHASVFVTMSEHEGVCVPLLEAMSFGVPVVARDRAAISSTMGGAGILLPPGDDPVLAAEAIAIAITDEPLRSELIARGRRRVGDFDIEIAQATFLGHLASVA